VVNGESRTEVTMDAAPPMFGSPTWGYTPVAQRYHDLRQGISILLLKMGGCEFFFVFQCPFGRWDQPKDCRLINLCSLHVLKKLCSPKGKFVVKCALWQCLDHSATFPRRLGSCTASSGRRGGRTLNPPAAGPHPPHPHLASPT
jgi:hypothetical protein